MKKSIIISMFVLSVGLSFAGTGNNVHKEIQRKVYVDLSNVELEKDKQEFVSVKFKLENNKVNIISIEGSKKELTEIMIKELEELVINSATEDATTYHCKFKFEKE